MGLVERLRRLASQEDMLACEDILQAADEIDRLRAKHIQFVKLIDDQLGTPCEQVRHEQEVENLRAEVEYWKGKTP